MKVRQAVLKEMAQRYQASHKKVKRQIVQEIKALAGYNRFYASWLLPYCGKKVVVARGWSWSARR